MLRRNVLLPSSGSKSKQSILCLLLDPDDGGNTCFPNVSKFIPHYTKSYFRRRCKPYIRLCKVSMKTTEDSDSKAGRQRQSQGRKCWRRFLEVCSNRFICLNHDVHTKPLLRKPCRVPFAFRQLPGVMYIYLKGTKRKFNSSRKRISFRFLPLRSQRVSRLNIRQDSHVRK